MAKRGMTLIELSCVIGILFVLMALLMAVGIGAKDRANAQVSASNLKQIHLQTSMYQSEWDGDARYGSVYAMGLPPWPVADRIKALHDLRPPKAPHPATTHLGLLYWTLFTQPDLDQMPMTWTQYASQECERSVLYIDIFDNEPSIPLDVGNHVSRRFLAVNCAGSLVRKRGKGDWMLRSWWVTPP
jgi:type II secretory pathway pseudopilin PulG